MKFTLKQVKNGCRLGLIESTQGRLCKEETPMCMLYTRAGSVPNLTRDMLDRIERPPRIVHMPVPLLIDHCQTVQMVGEGIKKFTVLQDYMVYCSIQDPAVSTPTGYNDKTGVSVWSRGGRVKIDSSLYQKMVKAFKPDACQLLADSDTDIHTPLTRLKKSRDRSRQFTEEVLEARKSSQELQDCCLVGTVTGGWDKAMRQTSVKELINLDLLAVAFEGFHRLGPDTESFRITEIQEILQDVKVTLDKHPNMLRVWHGIMSPYNVLCAVEQGIDILDSSYPYIVTERGAALVFPYDVTQKPADNFNLVSEISLSDKRFTDDLSPVLAECDCYTCQHHTKAYICHLLNTSELLAGVLLSVHNFHHYFRFFEHLRKSLSEDTYTEFRSLICLSYNVDS